MIKLLVRGSISYNLGDDLFIRILADRYKHTQINVIAPKDYRSFCGCDNVLCIGSPLSAYKRLIIKIVGKFSRRLYLFLLKKQNFRFYRKHIKSSDAYIIIGGSMFKEARNSDITFAVNESILEEIGAKKIFIIGANFGPYSSVDFLNSYRQYFHKFTDVCFRDKYSYDLFSDLDNVRMHKDVIFQYPICKIEKDEKSVGFVVVDFSQHPGLSKYISNYEKFILRTAMFYVSKHYNFTLISFQENENKYLQSLRNKFYREQNMTRINILSYSGDVESFVSEYGKFHIVFATRFHSMILSFMYRQKVCPIIYNKKLMNYIKDLEYPGLYVTLDDLTDVSFNYDEIEGMVVPSYDFKLDSELQFQALDTYINNIL